MPIIIKIEPYASIKELVLHLDFSSNQQATFFLFNMPLSNLD